MSLLSTIMSFVPSLASPQAPTQPTLPFTPTYNDILAARALLETLKLPLELVLEILDYAAYWTAHDYHSTFRNGIHTTAAGLSSSGANICMHAPVFENATVASMRASGDDDRIKVKAVDFRVTSRDQGWTSEGSDGTFNTSSWLEVSILRADRGVKNQVLASDLVKTAMSGPAGRMSHPKDLIEDPANRGWCLAKRPKQALQDAQVDDEVETETEEEDVDQIVWYLQGNRVAAGNEDYHVAWTVYGNEGNEGAGAGEGFLGELLEGDYILVWGRAQWPGWKCIVDHVTITIRYGF